MAKKRRRARRKRVPVGDIWALSNRIMEQQLGQQTQALRAEYEKQALPGLIEANAAFSGQAAGVNSIDEVNQTAGAIAQAVAGQLGQAAQGWRRDTVEAVKPWTRDVSGFLGEHGAPDMALFNIGAATSGAAHMFERGAAPTLQAAQDQSHDLRMQAKLDAERMDAELRNTAEGNRLAAQAAHRQYLDALKAIQPKDVTWAPEDYADYLKLQEGREGEWAQTQADFAGINAGLELDAMEDAQEAWEEAQGKKGKQTKARTEGKKKRQSALKDIRNRMSRDEGLWGVQESWVDDPSQLEQWQIDENKERAKHGLPPKHKVPKKKVTVRYRKGWKDAMSFLANEYQEEWQEMSTQFGLSPARYRKIIRAALIQAGLRPPGFGG